MKKGAVIIPLLILLALIGTASAVEVTLFGPQQNLRTSGEPDVYTDTFRGVPGEGKLVIKNGDENDKHRVTSALVFVNGEQIFGPSDFKNKIYLLEIPINLNKDNSISLELRGKPGTYLTVEVTEDVPPPTVTISANPLAINIGESVTLSWSSENADTCIIEPGIGSVDLSGSIIVSPAETVTYIITATGLGGTATASAGINVNYPPVADAQPVTTDEDTAVSITLTGSDPNEDLLTFQVLSNPVNGTLTGTPPQLTYTPYSNFNGTDSFTFKANDGRLDSDPATVSITVNPVNDPPVAVDDTVTTDEDVAAVTGNVLANDLDVDEDTLIVAGFTQPAGGSVVNNEDGTFTYTPNPDFNGADSFTYTAGDGTVTSEPATVAIQVNPVNDPPIANDDAVTTKQDTPVTTGNVLDNDTDVEEDTLTVSDYTQPAYGDVISHGDGTFTYTPNPAFHGTDNFTYTASDGNGGTAVASVTITVIPLPAVTISASPETVLIGESATLTWSCANTDSVTIDQGIGPVDPHGSLSVFPTETTTYTITATGPGGTATAAVTVTVISSPPTVSLTADTSTISTGGVSILSWSSTYADTCVIEPGIGPVSLSGSIPVSPGTCTTYTITATGPGGSASASTTVSFPFETKVTAGDAGAWNEFGISVSISGDYAIVGANDDDAGWYSGAAYVFKRGCSSWAEQAKLTADDGASYDQFGGTVDISGDYAVVGASGNDAAYVFKREGSTWTQQAKLLGFASTYSIFGSSVSISGDYIIVGDMGANQSKGTAYVFKRQGNYWVRLQQISHYSLASYDYFGNAVSISGDYAIVGAYGDDSRRGAAYIFRRGTSNWGNPVRLTAADRAYNDRFGGSVDISGDYVIVGARYNDDNGTNSGTAYIFKRNGSSWTQQAKLTAGDAASQDHFGMSVSISGDYAAIGAEGDDGGGSSSGSVYIFKREGATWTQYAKVTQPDAAASDYFGESVAISGNTVIAGAYGDDDNGYDAGSAFISDISDFNIPSVNITAAPETIDLGDSAVLTWSSENATYVSIDQGIGSVDVNGSRTVSPAETTTYTITAAGPGGAAEANITVTVIPPLTVSISADPETILVGGSAVLAWTSTGADAVTIDPGIGSVALNGSVTVSPAETTTYTITATGSDGTATAEVTVTVTPIALSITSVSDGETISRPDAMIYGTVSNLTGNETGVVVNGIIAVVYGNHFVANHVPLQEGENTITVTATDTDGNTTPTSITINGDTTGDYIRITADTESGVAPFESTLTVDGSFSFTESSISYTGPDVVEFLGSTDENEYPVRITTPGIYYFTAEVTDGQSNTYTDTVAIVVFDQAELDALLKAKWNGMRQGLSQNDIDTAVKFFDSSTKEAFRNAFSALSSSQLVEIANELDNVQFYKMSKNSVEYDIRVFENDEEYSFYLLFIRDDDGLWKIRSF